MTNWVTIFCLSSLLVYFSPTYADKKQTYSPILSDAEIGKRIYREGLLPDGQPLRAKGAGDVTIIGTQLTCVSCHRRSGLGASEGKNRAPPITGEILFQPRTRSDRELAGIRLSGEGARPAYTEESLLQAINNGKDAAGRTMDPLMPRYAFDKADLKLLIQYLNTLSTASAPGISETTIHFAAVFTPDASPTQKAAAEKTLRSFFHAYNAQTRREKQRAENPPWHKAWQYNSFRGLELHTWNLAGAAQTWHSQLLKYYQEQPVFALVNGIGNGLWQPIHDFCEKNAIPCLFPTTDLPGQSVEHHYSLYFSGGMDLEARAIASHIETANRKQVTLLQLYRMNEKSNAAAISLSRQFVNSKKVRTINLALDDNTALNNTALRDKIRHKNVNTLVLWLEEVDIKNINQQLDGNPQIRAIYVSSTYLKSPTDLLPKSALDKTYVLSRFVPAKNLDAHLRRFAIWAASRDIDFSDKDLFGKQAAANAYFTALVVSSAIKGLRANLTRDYLIERIEHILERPVFHSVYPEFTLGPGQKFASKGGFITGPLKAPDTNSIPPSRWIVP
ncbi:MAG: c-type cytochrome [Gammaproteobacteria bacterium]|nr:c-type cytochrome [Gammaproteobacteria bacterium]